MDIETVRTIIKSSLEIKKKALANLSDTVANDVKDGRYNTAAFNAAEARGYKMVIDQLEYLIDIFG